MHVLEMNNNLKSIKCFSIDHRDAPEWQFPTIRIGTGFNAYCPMKDTIGEHSICTEENDVCLSEWTAIYWVWKNLNQFGNADFVGFTHYRRFFTMHNPNYGVFPLYVVENFSTDMLNDVLTPEQLLSLILSKDYDGILPIKFPDYSYCNACKNVKQLMFAQSQFMNFGMTHDICDSMFNIFKDCCVKNGIDNELVEKSFNIVNTYHFNIYVLRRKLFELYMKVIHSSVMDCISMFKTLDKMTKKKLHPRAIAYTMERFVSCLFYIFIFMDFKFVELPLIVFEKASYKK